MDRLVFGMHHLNITQSGTLMDGKPNLSHPNYALDLAGEDSGIDFWKNIEADTYFYCSGAFGTRSTGNTRFFVSCDAEGKKKEVMCADGKARVVTLAMTHSDRDFQLYHIYKPQGVMYQEGTQGKATGNHIHLEVAEGSQKTKYYDSKLGVYRMMGEFDPRDAFFIYDKYTTVVSTHGLTFRHCDRIEVNNMSDAETLIEFAKTQIGQKGQRYWDYFGYVDPWCSEFVAYCAEKTGMVSAGLMPRAGNCQQAHDFYKPKGLLHKKEEYDPVPGDIIFFGKDGLDHTGIVEKVDGVDVTVIEGNAGDTDYTKSKVCRTVYKKNNTWLWGYANPLTKGESKPMEKRKLELDKDVVYGGIATADGVEFQVKDKATILLTTAHNSTKSLNSMWVINLGNNKAFEISATKATLKVECKDMNKVTIKTDAGNPRTYWQLLG